MRVVKRERDFIDEAMSLYVSEREKDLIWKQEQKKCPWLKVVPQEPSDPLSGLLSFGKKKESLNKGYVRQIRAGRWIERRILSSQRSSCGIVKLPHEASPFDDEEVFKPYYLKSDVEFVECTLDPAPFVRLKYGRVPFAPVEGRTWLDVVSVPTVKPENIRIMRSGASSRPDNIRAVREACNKFKWLVRANERKIRLFLTLTYAENMTDTKQLYQDFRIFWQKLQYHYPKISGYLVAFEPQKRGAWHAHVLLCSDDWKLKIPNKELHDLWGHGFTKTQKIFSVADVGAYLTAYLTNMRNGERTKKGARLSLYPPGFRFARHSKFILYTDVTRWCGQANVFKVDLDNFDLLYDYENSTRISDNFTLVNRRFCFLRKGEFS